MSCERIHVWIGNFETSHAPDYFTETFSTDDTPLSPFVADQGEIFVDHDWMELSWFDHSVDVADLLSRHMVQVDQRETALSIAHEKGFQEAFLIVTIDDNEVSEPRSIENPPLIYLGCFDNQPPGPAEIEAAALAGDANAQAAIGRLFIFPPPANPEMKDADKAEYWLLKAAENGKAHAYNGLYHVYSGDSDKADPEKAFYYIQKAVELGSAADFNYLSEMFATGRGTSRDEVQALTYKFLQVCSYDSDRYDDAFRALAANMSDTDIAEARKRALAWIEAKADSAPYFGGFVRDPVTNLLND